MPLSVNITAAHAYMYLQVYRAKQNPKRKY